MQNSTEIFVNDRRLTRISRNSLKQFVLFCTGVMTVFHLVVIFSYAIYALIIGLLFAGCILCQGRNCFYLKKGSVTYLLWYGAFYGLILFSLLYTVNNINPDYVIKRCSVIFVLGYIAATLVKQENDFITLSNGLIAGALCVVAVSLLNESMRVGVKRLGDFTVGSAVLLSNITLTGYSCAIWRFVFVKKKRWLYGLLAIAMLAIIALTGSRRSFIIAIMTVILFVVTNKSIKKSKRVLFFLIMLLCVTAAFYFILTNDALYNIIGWRIESMVETFFNRNYIKKDKSMLERSIMRQYAYDLFWERPIFGYGAYGFAYKFLGYYGLLVHSHCGFSEILACYGIVGFILFYRIFLVYIIKGFSILKRGTDTQVFMVIYAMLTLLCEFYAMAFLAPYIVVVLSAGINIIGQKHR